MEWIIFGNVILSTKFKGKFFNNILPLNVNFQVHFSYPSEQNLLCNNFLLKKQYMLIIEKLENKDKQKEYKKFL